MPGVRLEGCKRGNGDGEPINPNERVHVFCDCPVCKGSRWLQVKLMRGQLAPAQESAVRECIRAQGGEA
jgi:hypothetical protein